MNNKADSALDAIPTPTDRDTRFVFLWLVPGAGLEPAGEQILSLLRVPFRQPGAIMCHNIPLFSYKINPKTQKSNRRKRLVPAAAAPVSGVFPAQLPYANGLSVVGSALHRYCSSTLLGSSSCPGVKFSPGCK